MKLTKLRLTQFKNYDQLQISFKNGIICFAGDNGEGKTNLLDAIYYCCIGKSYFNSVESQNITHGSDFFRFDAELGGASLEIVNQKGTGKQITKNKIDYERLSDHLGFAPVTFIAPDDNILILGGSRDRRRFMNTTISQMNKGYGKDLLAYRKVLRQRNANLKSGKPSKTLLTAYNEQLIPLAEMIFAIRKKYVNELNDKVQQIYAAISKEKESVSCEYLSQLKKKGFPVLLTESYEKDVLLQRTTTGIHKDDLKFSLNGRSMKKYGSQGQQKTFLLALKIAECELMYERTGKQPLLLLDDIFDKLDRGRVRELFQYLLATNNGQLFMTDTNAQRLHQILSDFDVEFTIFIVQNNQLTEYERGE